MKKMVFLLMIPLLFCGCGKNVSEPTFRVVTGVEVEYRQQDNVIYRTYRKPGSMQSILTYLRILQPFGPVNPVDNSDSACQITLHYSHGEDSVYIQRGQYLQKDGGDWETVDSTRASLLYPLLLLLPSDS